jgi:cytochrome bd ubiquinol oxidase subunit II
MSYPFDLQIVWFFLVGVLLTGYAVLDGFDLGVGALHLFAKGDTERRTLLNSIGPVWDGNEVWLVVGGGALFAAFPPVYATVFSAFYLPFMLLLVALIFRAVAIEFRSKHESEVWRRNWDVSFSVASVLIALLAGVALGNMVVGIPIDKSGLYHGGFFNLLNPYSLMIGVTTVSLFAMHGAIYVVLKTEGELQQKARIWVNRTIWTFIVCYVVATVVTLLFMPHMARNFKEYPILLVVPLVNLLTVLNIPREIFHKREMRAFLFSCLNIGCLLALFGIGLFPNIVTSSMGLDANLTLRTASSSLASQTTMFSITLLGLPFVLAYTAAIYWVFRGKVDTESLHY